MVRIDALGFVFGCGFGLLLLLPTAAKAGPADEAGERRQLAAERLQIDARFEREQAECRQRFALNACVDDARTRQRQALADLRGRERVLDEQQRQQRASDRQAAIVRKQQAQQAQQPRPPEPLSAPAAAPASVASSASRPSARPRSATDRAQAQAKAAERAAAASKLKAAAEADQERIKRRQAQRAAQGKKADPLPSPASSPG